MAVDTSWADVTQAAADALATLRLAPGDMDQARIDRCAEAAAGIIGAYLDRPDLVDPPTDEFPLLPITDPFHLMLLREAMGRLTAELYLRKDAPFGVFDAFDQDSSSYRIGSDPLAGIRHLVMPMKARWGIA